MGFSFCIEQEYLYYIYEFISHLKYETINDFWLYCLKYALTMHLVGA
jgi:hypothetical protein